MGEDRHECATTGHRDQIPVGLLTFDGDEAITRHPLQGFPLNCIGFHAGAEVFAVDMVCSASGSRCDNDVDMIGHNFRFDDFDTGKRMPSHPR